MTETTPPAGPEQPAEQPQESYKVFLRYVGPDLVWGTESIILKYGVVYQFQVSEEGARPEVPGSALWWLPVDAEALETTLEEAGLAAPVTLEQARAGNQVRIWTPEELRAGALREDWPVGVNPEEYTSGPAIVITQQPEEPTDA